MLDDIWSGTPFEDFLKGPTFEDMNSGSLYGDPDKSRVSPTGTTTHHDIQAYDEYTNKVNPPKDFEDPNNSYQKVGAAMNHIDDRWGENYDEPFGRPPHSEHHAKPRHISNPDDHPFNPPHPHHHHHQPDHVVIDTPPMQQFTPADVEEVYGYTEHNMNLLTVSSVRIAKLTQVLNSLQDQSKGIDLVRIMEQVPFASTSFREVLEKAFSIEMQNYLAVVEKLNEYIYGTPPDPEPEPEPTPEEPDPEPDPDESEAEPTTNELEPISDESDPEVIDPDSSEFASDGSVNVTPTDQTETGSDENPITFDDSTNTNSNG